MQVIGAGLPRTGTLTQKLALEKLGLGPCYHWVNLISDLNAVEQWHRALDGEDMFEEIFAGYDSTVDWPGGFFYRELAERHPEAKVLLSVRDPERVGAQLPRNDLELHPGRLADPPPLGRPPGNRPALASLPGARATACSGASARRSAPATIPAQMDSPDGGPQPCRARRDPAGAPARVEGDRRLGAAVRVPRRSRPRRTAAPRERHRHLPRTG